MPWPLIWLNDWCCRRLFRCVFEVQINQISHWLTERSPVAKERERRQYDPVKHLKGHCQIFKAFNKKWHLPPLLSLYFFLKHEKSSKMYSFEDQNALSLFDIILVAHTEKRSAVCSFDGSPVKNQFTGSKSSGVSLIWRGFDNFCLMVRWMTYSQCVTILLPK